MFFKSFINKLNSKSSKVAIIGAGYVGIPLALACSKIHKTIVYDIDINKINHLNKGISPINTVKNNEIINYIKNKNLFSHSIYDLNFVDILIICLPTPLNRKNQPDISYLEEFAKSLTNIDLRKKLISLESSSYPGTSQIIIDIISRNKKYYKFGNNIFFSYSPEREDPGNKKYKNIDLIKIVSGKTNNCKKIANLFYKSIGFKTVLSSNLETAEFCKIYENSFRSVNIAFVNQAKELAIKSNLDINEVVRLASTKDIGFMPFYPGPGIGGHCIPVDPVYLSTYSLKKYKYKFSLIEESNNIHKKTINNVVKRTISISKNNFKNKKKIKLLIIGCTYKKNVNDFRDSPAIPIIKKLNKIKLLNLTIIDPYIDFYKNNMTLKTISSFNKINNLSYDLGLILTDHDIFLKSDIKKTCRYIIDTRNMMPYHKNIIKI